MPHELSICETCKATVRSKYCKRANCRLALLTKHCKSMIANQNAIMMVLGDNVANAFAKSWSDMQELVECDNV